MPPDINTIGRVKSDIVKKMVKRDEMAYTKLDSLCIKVICLTRGPKRQKLSLRDVWTVPMVYCKLARCFCGSKRSLTQRVRCLMCPTKESGTVPYCKASCTYAVFQPAPRSIEEVQTSSARDPVGNQPISSIAVRRMA